MGLTPCANFSRQDDNYTYMHLKRVIKPETTSEEFEEEVRQYQEAHPSLAPFTYDSTTTYGGCNVVHLAAYNGNVGLIEHFVRQGGRELLDTGNKYGGTPLHCSVERGHVLATRTLLRLGANPNIFERIEDKSWIPSTPLFNALNIDIPDKIAITKLLLRNGAQIHPDTPLEAWQERILHEVRNKVLAPYAFTFCWEQLRRAHNPDDAVSRDPQRLEVGGLPKDIVQRVCKLLSRDLSIKP